MGEPGLQATPTRRGKAPAGGPAAGVAGGVTGEAAGGGPGAFVLFAFLIAFLVPNQIGPTIAGVYLPPIRIALLVFFIPILILFISRISKKLYAFDVFYMLFVVWSCFCILLNRGAGGVQLAGQFFLEFAGAYMLAVGAMTTYARFKSVFAFLFVSVAILLVFAIPEAILHKPLLLNAANSLVGLPPVIADERLVRLGLQRVMSVFSFPILYGVYCATIFSFVWKLETRPGVALFKAAVIGVATALALSSAPFLTFLIQIALLVGERMTRGVPRRFTLVASLVAGGIALVNILTNRGALGVIMMLTLNPATAWYRSLIWTHSVDDVMRHPIFGFREETWTRLHWMTSSVDNFWVMLAMRGGLPAPLFLILALVLLYRAVFRAKPSELPARLEALRRGWAFSMFGLIICGVTVHFFDKTQSYFALIVGAGAALARILAAAEGEPSAAGSERPAPPPSSRPPSRTVI